MNKVIMQIWEESRRGCGTSSDGCSLHIDSIELSKFIKSIYGVRKNAEYTPDEYDMAIGDEIETFIDDKLFKIVSTEKSIRLSEIEMNNLIKMEELIPKPC
jgi:hypothetical protein